MGLRTFFATALMAAGVMGQSSVNWTDTNSDIKYSYYNQGDIAFGIASPETYTGDFIGYIASSSIDGYAAMSMTGAMANALLICAWVDGDKIVASLREATGYSNPPEVTNSSMGIYEISKGTSINSTGWAYTFLCKGCATGTSISFGADDDQQVFGYGQSVTALSDTSSSDATLNFHSNAYGEYAHSIADSKSSNYATWAALASTTNAADISGSSTSSNSTMSSNNSTTTATTTTSNSTYDYIVAGGGQAGIIVAERLVESGASVLLVERGGASSYSCGGDDTMSWNDTVTQYDVPGMGYYLTSASDTSEYCTDTGGMAGCLLGGSGSVNAMMFVKPPQHDFENWPAGWQWSDVESSASAFYERTPGYILANSSGCDQEAFSVMSSFLDSNGFSQTDALANPNEKEAIYSHPPWLVRDGLRGGPVKDYLPLAQAKSNFKLSLNTKLIRVVRNNSTATGVEVETSSGARQIINLKSGGSVILAGGALSTPRMLINSGIGPKEQIQTVKSGSVSVTLPDEADWLELPVGKYLQDHPIFTVELTTKDSLYAEPKTAFTSPNSSVTTEFNTLSSGLLAQPGQRLNFWTTTTANDSSTYYVQGTVNAPSTNTIKIKTYLTHGITSTGVLGITSQGATEITTTPYLQTASDKAAITNWMNKLISMVAADDSPFEALNKTAAELIDTTNISEGDHYVGSARMGTANDGTSVVDTNLKVWGTDNIYVVDGSVHPDLPTGNSQAIIMVVAEQAAKVILDGASTTTTTTSSASSSSAASASSSASTGSASDSGSTSGSSSSGSSGPKKCKKRRAAAQL